ncbi:MAG: ABC transporter permease [Proteobacteria bacterium]|nr:ABC transporter permease [Pseudomonadota bacterium]
MNAAARRRLDLLLRPVVAVAASLGVVALLLALLGYPPGRALGALLEGAFGSPAAWTATLLKTCPLLLTGLAVALCFRSGVWNIGAEGQFVTGALFATVVATRWLAEAPGFVALPALLSAGVLGGAAVASVAGVLRARRGVSEVISTILLNFIALQLVAYAVHGPLQGSGGYPQSDAFPAAARLPAWGRVHLGVPLAALLAAACSVGLFRTAAGFRLRAVGLSPVAARFSGISPERYGVGVLAFAGGLAGLAGALEVAGVTGRLFEKLSPGYGYTAIAVALLARLHPLAVVPSALFFGALEAGAGAMQREARVPAVATEIVQGVVIVLSIGLAFARSRTTARAEEDG